MFNLIKSPGNPKDNEIFSDTDSFLLSEIYFYIKLGIQQNISIIQGYFKNFRTNKKRISVATR